MRLRSHPCRGYLYPISYKDYDREVNAYAIGDHAIAFDKKFANFIKKRSAYMKVISGGHLSATLLVGYDADNNITAFALPMAVKGEVTAKDGTKYSFVNDTDIKNTVNDVKGTVTETAESVAETQETEENPPATQKAEGKSKNALFKKLTDSIPLLENDVVVYAATGKEFEVGEKKLSQQVYDYFESLGGVVHRDNFGDVAINDKGVDSSIAHGMGRAKAIAFASVPAVIEKGRQIDFVENWKGRNYDSYVFAAPILIGTQTAYVGVVVTKSDVDNRYYLHEVSDNEGNIIIIKKDDVSFKSKSEATNDSSSLGETSPTNRIAQDNEIVNEKNSVITSYISGMNKAVKALPEEEQRNGRAYLLKALNNWDYDTVSQKNMLSNLKGASVDRECIFDSLPSSELEWTVDKQKYVYQMTPQEYHKYISDYMTVIENARKYYGGNTVDSYEAAKKAAKDYMSDYKKNILKERYLRKAVPKTE